MKKKAMTDVERAIFHKRRLIARWKAEQEDWKAQAEEECRVLQKKIDRESVLIQALERGDLKP